MTVGKNKDTKANKLLLAVYKKGYHVTPSGNLINPSGKERKLKIGSTGYLSASVCDGTYHGLLKVHRLAAYQKFGTALFASGVQVRHLDGNCRNNRIDNIAIGTASDNCRDKPVAQRVRQAIEASSHMRRFNDSTVADILFDRSTGMTYPKLMDKYGISSKGTLSFMLNKSHYANRGPTNL